MGFSQTRVSIRHSWPLCSITVPVKSQRLCHVTAGSLGTGASSPGTGRSVQKLNHRDPDACCFRQGPQGSSRQQWTEPHDGAKDHAPWHPTMMGRASSFRTVGEHPGAVDPALWCRAGSQAEHKGIGSRSVVQLV